MNRRMIAFTAPSGAGKSTIVKHLLNTYPQLDFSISATTRNPRPHEVTGKDYYFLSVEDFKRRIDQDEFVEYEEVYEGLLYGTLKSEIDRAYENGKYLIFDIDVLGASSLKEIYGHDCLTVFIKPPSLRALEERLRNRRTESTSDIQKRVERFKKEMKYENRFDIVLVNDILETALDQAENIVETFLNISKNECSL